MSFNSLITLRSATNKTNNYFGLKLFSVATIRQENVIISVTTETEKARKELRKIRDEVVGIGTSVGVTQKELKSAFTDNLVNQYRELIQDLGGEFQDLEELSAGLREGIENSLVGLSEEQAIEALERLNQIILEARESGSDFTSVLTDSLSDLSSQIPLTIEEVGNLQDAIEEVGTTETTIDPIEVPIKPVVEPINEEELQPETEEIAVPVKFEPIPFDPNEIVDGIKPTLAKLENELNSLDIGLANNIRVQLSTAFEEAERRGISLGQALDDVFENSDQAVQETTREARKLLQVLEQMEETDPGGSFEEGLRADLVKRFNTLLEESGDIFDKLGLDVEDFKLGLEGSTAELLKLRGQVRQVEKAVEEANEQTKKSRGLFVAIGRVVRGLRGGVSKFTDRIATGVQSGVRSIFGFIGRIGSLATALGIADLITGWSTFAKQFQATVRNVPGFGSAIDSITFKFRQLAELFGRTLGPLIQRFVNFITTGLENTNLGGIERAFSAIGVLFTNMSSAIARIFAPGGEADQGFDSFIDGFTNMIGIANGIWNAFISILETIKPFFLDLGATVTGVLGTIASAIPGSAGIGGVLIGQSAALRDQANEARKGIENFVVAYKRGVKEIEDIPVSDIKWEDITPTPTEEEKKAILKRFTDLRKGLDDLVADWMKTLNNLNEEFPVGGSNNITNVLQDVNERFFELTRTLEKLKSGEAASGIFDSAIKELEELRKTGAITATDFENQMAVIRQLQDEELLSDAQVQAAIGLIEQLRTRALEPLRKEFDRFTSLPPLRLQTGLDAELRQDDPRPGRISDDAVVGQGAGADPIFEPEVEIDNLAGIADILTETGSLFDGIFDGINAGIDRTLERINSLAEAQAGRVSDAAKLAERGNAEILESEVRRLEQIEAAREQALAKQRKIAAAQVALNSAIAVSQAVVAITRAAAETSPFAAIAAAIALAASIASAIVAVNQAFSNISGFREGTPFLDGPGNGRSDSIPIRGSRGERIVDAKTNQRIGGRNLSNSDLENLVEQGRRVPGLLDMLNNQRLISVPPPEIVPGFGLQIVEGLESVEDTLNRKLDAVTDELISNRKTLEKLKVEFLVTPEGLEASVRTVQSSRDRKRQLIR